MKKIIALFLLLTGIASAQTNTTSVTMTRYNQQLTGISSNLFLSNSVLLHAALGDLSANTTYVSNSVATVSVLNFGATGNGTDDDTAAFQAAVNASPYVTVPPLNYLILGTILVPPGVHLVGCSTPATAYNYPVATTGLPPLGAGSVLEFTSTGVSPFIYNSGDWFDGLTFLYPNQLPTLTTPIVYPPTFIGTNNGASIVDPGWHNCNFVNPYIGIVITNLHGPANFINLTFWTPHQGILEDNGGDVDFYSNIRFSSGYFASQSEPLVIYASTNATCIQLGRADGFRMQNPFYYNAKIGLKTVIGVTGNTTNTPWGSIVDMESDNCQYGWWCESGTQISASNLRGNDLIYDFYVPPGITYNNQRIYMSNVVFDQGTQTNNVRVESQIGILSINGGEMRNFTNAGGSASIKIDSTNSNFSCANVNFNGTSIPLTNTATLTSLFLMGNNFNATNALTFQPTTFRYRGNTALPDASGGP